MAINNSRQQLLEYYHINIRPKYRGWDVEKAVPKAVMDVIDKYLELKENEMKDKNKPTKPKPIHRPQGR